MESVRPEASSPLPLLRPRCPAGDRLAGTDASRVRPVLPYRLIREIFVPSMPTPAINPCWLNIKA